MCCGDNALAYLEAHASWHDGARHLSGRDLSGFVQVGPDGSPRAELAVEGVRCAACMAAIERGIGAMPGVTKARLNFSDRRLAVTWAPDREADIGAVIARLDGLGYGAQPFDPRRADEPEKAELRRLVRALAVAGFASMNVMLLAVSVWAGNVSDMTAENRDFFHWMQALVALPAAAYAGQPFFRGAISGLKAGRVTMDFPIALGVVATLVMSVFETATGAHHAYFDGAVMLLFFLLIGRVLDQTMRRKTRTLAENLAALRRESAGRVDADGQVREVPIGELAAGDLVLVRPGERMPVDGVVERGASQADLSLVTGETAPVSLGQGDKVYAGALNFDGALTVRVTAAAKGTFLDEVEALMSRALDNRSRLLDLASQATRLYVPLVHAAAAITLVAWLLAGAGWHAAILSAVAVLIITCPCALGLAIPAVQVAAAGLLFRDGILLASGDALERYAAIDTVVFDKTGTLTLPEPRLAEGVVVDPALLEVASRLALSSRHPMAGALSQLAQDRTPFPGAEEAAGLGVRALVDGVEIRLGSPAFCEARGEAETVLSRHPDASVICVRMGTGGPVALPVHQALRPEAVETVAALMRDGYRIAILSGDRRNAVASVAARLGIEEWFAELSPAGKIAHIEDLGRQGRRVLMVGDGLNDAPALAAAHASLSPVTAAHVSQAAADAVFLGRGLEPVRTVLAVGRRAKRIMMQNLWFAALYNVLAVPLAGAGFLTPLIAALAMSGSSVVVSLNAVRLRLERRSARPNAETEAAGRAVAPELQPA
jgi:Cu2+-exporting ATPase